MGLVIKVPITKLSAADKKFLADMDSAPAADPFAGGTTEDTEPETTSKLTSLKAAAKPFNAWRQDVGWRNNCAWVDSCGSGQISTQVSIHSVLYC